MGGDLAKQSFLLNTQISFLNIQVIPKTSFTKNKNKNTSSR